MKKLSILIVILIATCTVALAQPRAVGGRICWGIGPSYQHSIGGDRNMIQVDLDIAGFHAIQATATYNWIFPIPWNKEGSWNWYAGVGGGIGYSWWGDVLRGLGAARRAAYDPYGYAVSHAYGGRFGSVGAGCGFVGVVGIIGVEYNCKFPMQVFIDYRPLIGPCFYKKNGYTKNVDFYYGGLIESALAVGLRYNF